VQLGLLDAATAFVRRAAALRLPPRDQKVGNLAERRPDGVKDFSLSCRRPRVARIDALGCAKLAARCVDAVVPDLPSR
jgi:hypothetical protein